MIARCPMCKGTKKLFAERPMAFYQGLQTRFYLGECTRCDKDGNITIPADVKKMAAVDQEGAA